MALNKITPATIVSTPDPAPDYEDAPLTRRSLPADLAAMQARREIDPLVDRVRQRAKAIVAEAERKATAMRAEAEREGHENAEASIAPLWQRLRKAESVSPRESDGRVLTVGRQLSERLLAAALEHDPSQVVDLARVALAVIARARRVDLYVNPADAELLRQGRDKLKLRATAIDVHEDPTQPRWGLRAETELGTVIAHLAPQLDRLLEALKQP